MDHNTSGRRPHYHRGRRGTDRRGSDRRSQQSADPAPRPSGDQLDVEQIMREIRSRIAQRGIELSPQQIQDLAAHRLEAILDPRNINPTLLDQLRRGAAAPPDPLPRVADADAGFTEEMLYAGSGLVGFFRRLFRPLLKLLFDPASVVAALQTQARLNREAAERASERERRHTEWNALHYQILQRLVTEVSRTSIEMQALTSRVEALAARIDFADRRVRALESAPVQARSQRPPEPSMPVVSAPAQPATPAETGATAGAPSTTSDAPRRRRRRRRGRRGALPGAESTGLAATVAENPDESVESDEGEEDEGMGTADVVEAVASEPAGPLAPEPAEPPSPAPLVTLPENTSAPAEPTPVPLPLPPDPDTSEQQ